jgi:hypothetical protein
MDKKTVKFKVIAGRGGPGDINFGASVVRHPLRLKWELKRLQYRIGSMVYLAGGGGNGIHSCKLDDARIIDYKGMGKALKVWLSNVEPTMAYNPDGKFDPYIDSWQILVKED